MRPSSLKKKYGKNILSLKDTRRYFNKKFQWVSNAFMNTDLVFDHNYNEILHSMIEETIQRVLEQYGPGSYIQSVNYSPETRIYTANVSMPLSRISMNLVLDNET